MRGNMPIIKSLQNDDFIDCVKKNVPVGSKIFLYIKTWQDGDGFLDLRFTKSLGKTRSSVIGKNSGNNFV